MIKNAQVANCNIVFGENERPMLEFFDTIFYPAMTSGITRTSGDNRYLFMNIDISENIEGYYVMTGILVKKTMLEIKSDLTVNGMLIEKNERYSSAPYSSFAINLLNHRMIFVPNQKGSPSLSSFRSTLKHVVDSYTKIKNMELSEDKKLENAIVNVVGIPGIKSMDELLDNVEKIESLTLRFYPLNGDEDYSEAFGILARDIRKEVGSKRGEIIFKSPKSISGIKRILRDAAGTIAPIIKGVTRERSKVTLTENEMTEKHEIEIDNGLDLDNERRKLVSATSEINSMNYTNNHHDAIYDKNKGKIIPFVNRK